MTIGFEQTVYSVTEGMDASVEICAVVMSGELDRNAVVMFSTSNGAATAEGGSTAYVYTGMYHHYRCKSGENAIILQHLSPSWFKTYTSMNVLDPLLIHNGCLGLRDCPVLV